MENKHTIPVEVEAHGFEDAAEKIELMADAIDSLPATVNIKAKDCEINVHTTNTIEQQKSSIKEYEPKGFCLADVLRPMPDYEPEADMIDRLISKQAEADREQELTILKRIKIRCKTRNECEGCWYYREGAEPDIGGCRLSGGIPKEWLI